MKTTRQALAALLIVAVAGCSTLNTATVTETAADVNGCQYLDQVESRSALGAQARTVDPETIVCHRLAWHASQLGGSHVLVLDVQVEDDGRSSGIGFAYACDFDEVDG